MKIIKSCFLIGLVLTLFTGPGYTITFKIATLSPEGSMWMEKMRQGATLVQTQTENRVNFKFYPGGVMGNDTAVLRKIRIGQLQGGAVVGNSLSGFFPATQIYAQPMKFMTPEEVDHVRQHMDPLIVAGLDQAGFVTFGLSGGGFAYIMSQKPIQTLQDLQSRKVWVPDNDKPSQDAISSFGITPIPLPLSDVRTGLQSGLIDTVATSPVAAIVLQWHTQIRYVTHLPFIYLYAVLAIDKPFFQKLSPDDQAVVSRIMTQTFQDIERQNQADDIKAIEALKNQGIKFITPETAHKAEWIKAAQKASRKLVESKLLPREMVDKMDQLLRQFHGQ